MSVRNILTQSLQVTSMEFGYVFLMYIYDTLGGLENVGREDIEI